jgi:hypothetical protein
MIRWAKEARDLMPDPVSGAKIVRLSGSSIQTHNIYCETPRATRDGSRFAAIRYIDGLISDTKTLLCIDLNTKWTGLIDREVSGETIAPAWGGCVYYVRGTMLMRAALETCSVEPVLDLSSMPPIWQMYTVSADERYLIYTGIVQDEPELYNLVRINLHDHSWKILLDEPADSRLGALYNPAGGHDMIVARVAFEGDVRYGVAVLSDSDGQNGRVVYSHVHHACWLGNTGRFAGLLMYDFEKIWHKPEYPDGELFIYSSDGTPPRLIPIAEHLFYHIASSPCGRYVVCESLICGYNDSPVPIVVVNVDTGKYATLVSDSGCRGGGGGDDGRQAKPYFTYDMRHVIYNADPEGIVNVYAAQIPDGFLAALD